MPFFDDIPKIEAPEPVPPKRQAWMAPPDNCIGGLLPVHYLLARTPQIAIALSGIVIYPNGFECQLVLRTRRILNDPNFFWHLHVESKESFDQMLKFGFEYPDGSKVTNLDRTPFLTLGDQVPDGPTMVPQGGGGGGRVWTQGLWIWPLPQGGNLTAHVGWRSQGLSESTAVIEGEQIAAAASEAIELWPEPADAGPPSIQGSVWSVTTLSGIENTETGPPFGEPDLE